MARPRQYKLLSAETADELETLVQIMLDAGWREQGELVYDSRQGMFVREMIRTGRPNREPAPIPQAVIEFEEKRAALAESEAGKRPSVKPTDTVAKPKRKSKKSDA